MLQRIWLFAILTVVVLLFITVPVAYANPFGENPFGFKMGMTQDDVQGLEGVVVDSAWAWDNKKILTLSKVPVPDARFVTFDLYFTEKHGLYTLLATSDTIRVGTGGQNIMSRYVELREELVKAYNGYTRSAHVDGVATWETAGDWILKVANGSGRHDFRAFISNWRPGFFKKSKQLNTVELSIRLSEPARLLLIFDYHNWFDANR